MAMLDWLKKMQPTIHIWENVPELLHNANEENMNWFINKLFQIGYMCSYSTFKSSKFGHPTKRERAYGVCINFRRLKLSFMDAVSLSSKILRDAVSLSDSDPVVFVCSAVLPMLFYFFGCTVAN